MTDVSSYESTSSLFHQQSGLVTTYITSNCIQGLFHLMQFGDGRIFPATSEDTRDQSRDFMENGGGKKLVIGAKTDSAKTMLGVTDTEKSATTRVSTSSALNATFSTTTSNDTSQRNMVTARVVMDRVSQKDSMEKPLFCLTSYRTSIVVVLPEDGLCDFMFLDSIKVVGNKSIAATGDHPDALIDFRSLARASRKTFFGISFCHRSLRTAVNMLHTPGGVWLVKEIWEDNIHQYGVLNGVIDNTTDKEYTGTLVNFLTTIRSLQVKMKSDASAEPECIFVGLKILGNEEGTTEEKAASLLSTVLLKAPMDGLLLRTEYYVDHHENPNCRVTGPGPWSGSLYDDQPSFVQALQFVDATTFPKRLVLFPSSTLMPHAYSYLCKPGAEVDARYVNFGSNCTARPQNMPFLAHTQVVCSAKAENDSLTYFDNNSMQMFTLTNTNCTEEAAALLYVYDVAESLHTKMCHVLKSYSKWRFGWALSDIELAREGTECYNNSEASGILQMARSVLHVQSYKDKDCGAGHMIEYRQLMQIFNTDI
ncbi:uncharacterized protein LOC135383973 isoform X2 [Ornithodoros turicata]|uniref:uncharacterized protein LOC135383973 isoform X2 n=1 Tax=Ornithodoros turicata TaxID=34597 RepID=UPI00313A2F93